MLESELCCVENPGPSRGVTPFHPGSLILRVTPSPQGTRTRGAAAQLRNRRLPGEPFPGPRLSPTPALRAPGACKSGGFPVRLRQESEVPEPLSTAAHSLLHSQFPQVDPWRLSFHPRLIASLFSQKFTFAQTRRNLNSHTFLGFHTPRAVIR